MLIDLETALAWLKMQPGDDDELIQELSFQATAIVIDYIKRPDHGWTVQNVPFHVKAAILHVLKRLYDDRDAEMEGGPFPAHIKSLLDRDRDPALA